MVRWFFNSLPYFEAKPGYEIKFTVTRAFNEGLLHCWKVLEVAAPTTLKIRWEYAGYPGHAIVSWQLSPTAAGTLLTLTHHGTNQLPRSMFAFTREKIAEDWRFYVQERLANFLQ